MKIVQREAWQHDSPLAGFSLIQFTQPALRWFFSCSIAQLTNSQVTKHANNGN